MTREEVIDSLRHIIHALKESLDGCEPNNQDVKVALHFANQLFKAMN